jgi:hypothetical protein
VRAGLPADVEAEDARVQRQPRVVDSQRKRNKFAGVMRQAVWEYGKTFATGSVFAQIIQCFLWLSFFSAVS